MRMQALMLIIIVAFSAMLSQKQSIRVVPQLPSVPEPEENRAGTGVATVSEAGESLRNRLLHFFAFFGAVQENGRTFTAHDASITASASRQQGDAGENTVSSSPAASLSGSPKPVSCETAFSPLREMHAFFLGPLEGSMPQFSVRTDLLWPLASLTKLMTAVVVRERMDLAERITVSDRAAATGEFGRLLKAGEIYRAYDLLQIMLVASNNQAAAALSETFGDTALLTAMRDKTQELGMTHTTYEEPTGLSDRNQSTAEDLLKLIRYIAHTYPELFHITTETRVEVHEFSKETVKTILNVDPFASRPDFLGGKTGFITASEQNFIGLFGNPQYPDVLIALGAPDRTAQVRTLLACRVHP